MKWKLAFPLFFLSFSLFFGSIAVASAHPITVPAWWHGGSASAYINFSTQRTFDTGYKEANASYTNFWFFDSYGLFTAGANMTVTKWFENTWLNYTVNQAGTQKLYPSPLQGAKPSTVYIDGIQKSENNGWTFTGSIVTVTAATVNASLSWGGGVDNPPQYGTVTTSTTKAGQTATLTCMWTDDFLLSAGLLSHNSTGPWQNKTEITLSGSSDTFSDTLTLPTPAGKVLAYKFYAKDNSDQWAATPTLYLTTTQEDTGGTSFKPPPPPRPSGYQLTVKVADAKGVVQAKAKVTVWTLLGAALQFKTTNTTGTVAFTLGPGRYMISAEKQGIAIETVNLEQDKQITLTLGAASTARPFSIVTQPLIEPIIELIGVQAYIILATTGGFILLGVATIIGILAFLIDEKWLLGITLGSAVLGTLILISIYITPIF